MENSIKEKVSFFFLSPLLLLSARYPTLWTGLLWAKTIRIDNLVPPLQSIRHSTSVAYDLTNRILPTFSFSY